MKTCHNCGYSWRSRHNFCPKCQEPSSYKAIYVPSPEEIRKRTAAIRATWNAKTRQKRESQPTEPVTIPIVQDPGIEDSFEHSLTI